MVLILLYRVYTELEYTSMKRLLLTLCAVAVLFTASYAQKNVTRDKKTPEEKARFMADAMQKRLNLDEKQKEQIYAINLERARAVENSAPADRSNKEAMKQKMQERKAKFQVYEDRINAVLNDEQKKSYEQYKQQARAKMGEHRKKGHPGKPGATPKKS